MTPDEQVDAFHNDLISLVNRYKLEFDMTYTQMVGVLEMYKMELFCEAMTLLNDKRDDDDEDEDFSFEIN